MALTDMIEQTIQRFVKGVTMATSPVLPSFLTDLPNHVLVISLVRGSKFTNITIEFSELEGGVRATSVLCLLGFGVGVGTLLLYKLYMRYLGPGSQHAVEDDERKRRPNRLRNGVRGVQEELINTPDSGISTVGHTPTTPGIGLQSNYNLRHRAPFSSYSESQLGHLNYESPINHHSSSYPPHCDNDSINFSIGGDQHSTPQSECGVSQGFNPGFNQGFNSQRPNSVSMTTPSGRFGLRRQPYSFCSEVGSGISDLSYCKDYMWHGHSVDLGENLSGLATPDTDVLIREEIGTGTVTNIDSLQQEIKNLQQDIADMNDKVNSLGSCENLSKNSQHQDVYDLVHSRDIRRMRERMRRFRSQSSLSAQSFTSEDFCSGDENSWNRSDFIWDYQSDLMLNSGQSNFVAQRPVSYEPGLDMKQDPQKLDHINKYLSQSTQNPNLTNLTNISENEGSLHQVSDMYIDDYGGCCFYPESDNKDNMTLPMSNSSPRSDMKEQISAQTQTDAQTQAVVLQNCTINASPNTSFSLCSKCGDDLQNCKGQGHLSHLDIFQGHRDINDSGMFSNTSCDLNGNNPCESLRTNFVFPVLFDPIDPNLTSEPNDPQMTSSGRISPDGANVARNSHNYGASTNNLNTSPMDTSTDSLSANLNTSLHLNVPSKCCSVANPVGSAEKWEVHNIGEKKNIFEYAQREWQGNTEKAETIKKGYHQIPSVLGLCQLRKIRGDNYCAIRATLYQTLVNNLPVRKYLGEWSNIEKKLSIFKDGRYSYLQNWNFANRLPYSKTQVYHKVLACVQSLYKMYERMSPLATFSEREQTLQKLLNENPGLDLELLEGVKVMMMLNALHLYEDNQQGRSVPVFVWLLFARDTSDNPERLLKNHINVIGDTGGLEQIEMFLLGHTLGVKIAVVRPSQYSKEDFVCHYPDDGADSFPKVYLIAEDDRHYNAISP